MKLIRYLSDKPQPQLSPAVQEKKLRDAATQKEISSRENQKDGVFARRLLDAMELFVESDVQINAPYDQRYWCSPIYMQS